jgi:flagellar biosynthetic protein FliR
VNTILSVLGRAVAQMNVFALSFPLTISAGLFAMGLALPYTMSLFEQEFMTLVDTMLGLMSVLGHG